ncbi:MAG: hypothetical protein RR855_04520 [Comamonas sp.]
MLEQIRRNRRLGTVVLWLCAALWLVALLAGVRARAMPLPAPTAAVALHPTPHAAPHGAAAAADPAPPAGAAVQQAAAAMDTAHPAADAAHESAHASTQEHDGHHGPDCLLCIALSPPAAVAVVVYRPPVPRQGLDWRAPAQQPPSLLAAAPLPARGPPAPFHA